VIVGSTQTTVSGTTSHKINTVRLMEIPDGTSSTLMIGERPPSSDLSIGSWAGGNPAPSQVHTLSLAIRGTSEVPISLPNGTDPLTGATRPCPRPYVFQPGNVVDSCGVNNFWSNHLGGALFAFADGSVRFVSYSAGTTRVQPENITLLEALATRDGGEVASD
jgi:hypothetical protein